MYRYNFGSQYTPEQAVFVDESSFDRRTDIRGRAWALSGKTALRKAFFVRGKRYVLLILGYQVLNYARYSLLPALSLDGIIAARLIEGSFTTATFIEFLRITLAKMNRFPASNSVMIMDNARIHRHPSIVQMIEEK